MYSLLKTLNKSLKIARAYLAVIYVKP